MPERKGGPVDPMTGFDAVFETLFKGDKTYKKQTDYPLYQYLSQFSSSSWPAPTNTASPEDGKTKGKEDKKLEDTKEEHKADAGA